jgi:ABC-2 type transport system ATP-binding protein
MIRTNALTRRFGPNLAVDSLDLDVREGELVALLGPNGAGKTTTVRMLSALIAPTSGEAIVGGFRVGQESDGVRRVVGLLTEAPGLYEKLSAVANLDFFGCLHDLSAERRRQQIQRYLEMLDLWDRRNEPVGGYSRGMKQKVAIARALLHEPRVIFLDEPTNGLDPESARTVREFIAELRQSGRTILLCTHNLDEAERLCDRVAIIKGRLVDVGTPTELRGRLYGRRVGVGLRRASPELVAAARALPFVTGARFEDGALVVDLSDPPEQTPSLVRALVAAGAEIQSVAEVRASLEDVYLDVVRREDGREGNGSGGNGAGGYGSGGEGGAA